MGLGPRGEAWSGALSHCWAETMGRAAMAEVEIAVRQLAEDQPPPAYAHLGDAGADLCAAEDVLLPPGGRAVVGTGLAVAIPEGFAGFVHPRSGLADRHGISIVNAPGLIDSGYRGELKVILLNTDADERFVVEPGMRVAQLVVLEVPELELVETQALPVTERGIRGHGSSGAGCRWSRASGLRRSRAGGNAFC